jgi:RecB family exonuclease
MERATIDQHADEILANPASMVLVTGPAGSGKTSLCLSLYEACIDDDEPRAALLAPAHPPADHLRRALLRRSPSGVIVRPRILTPAQLATSILSTLATPPRRVSALRRYLLLGRTIAQLARTDRLGALTGVAKAPGLVDAVDAEIALLQQTGASPEHLTRLLPPLPDKRGALVTIYAAYRDALARAGLVDPREMIRLAIDALGSAEPADRRRCLDGATTLLADGFVEMPRDLTDLLAGLAEGLDRLVVTLPDDGDDRDRLWAGPRRSTDRLTGGASSSVPVAHIRLPPHRAAAERPGDSLARRLFTFCPEPTSPPAGLAVIEAPDGEEEVRAVARRIKALLADGVEPGAIAVLSRRPAGWRERIERIFPRCDIPIAPKPLPLADAPVVRFLLAVAQLGRDQDAARLLSVISSSYFDPASLGEFDECTVRAARAVVAEGDVVAGRDAFDSAARALEDRLAGDQAGSNDTDDDGNDVDDEDGVPARPMEGIGPHGVTARDVGRARELVGVVFDLARRAVGESDGLLHAVDALALTARVARARDELAGRDLRALGALSGALGSLDGASVGPDALARLLTRVMCPAARTEALVDVLGFEDAAALRYDHVFLLGVAERQVPLPASTGALLGEGAREALGSAGLDVRTPAEHASGEMLLFHRAVTRAERTLTISYSQTDPTGRASGASAYLRDLLAPLGGLASLGSDRLERVPRGRYASPPRRIVEASEAVSAGVSGLFLPEGASSMPALSWARRHRAGLLRRVGRGLIARRRRWRSGECDRFDGRITDPSLREAIARRFGGESVFSSAMLNAYAACPWRFFARYVLGLRQPPAPRRQIEPVTRGQFIHRALQRTMAALRDELDRPVRLGELDEATIVATLGSAVEAVRDQTPAAYPDLWRLQCDQMREELTAYLVGLRGRQRGASLHFEVGFGLGPDAQDAKSDGRDKPIVLTTPTGPIRARGMIDRVDVVDLDGREALLVVDYKTGTPPSAKDVERGRDVQLPLYVEAVEQLFGKPIAGGEFHAVGRDKATSFTVWTRRAAPLAERRAAVLEAIGEYVAGMRAGRFDALPVHECPSWCAYREICQYSRARAPRKRSPEPEDER